MSTIFNELITGFGTRSGYPCTVDKGQYQATITVNNLQLHIGLQETSGMLVIQTWLCEVPEQDREGFLMLLLTANNLYSGTGGMCLGIDAEEQLVTLQLAWEIEHLNAERFDNLISHMLNSIALVMERIMAWTPRALQAGAAPSETSPDSVMAHLLKA